MDVTESESLEISRKLDEIATALILEASAPADPDRWADSISALRHLAIVSELTDFASLAGSVATQIRATPDSMTDEAARQEFTRAIEQLRAALDNSSEEDRSESA